MAMTVCKGILAMGLLAALSSAGLAQETLTEPAARSAQAAPEAATVGLTLTLQSTGNIERNAVAYQCDDGQVLTVQYINAVPNFLAIVPVEGENLVMTTVISGSGARYVAGPYEWWSHQGEATLRDVRLEEDEPALATCTEASNTP